MKFRLRTDAFIIGFSFKPQIIGYKKMGKYITVWMGFIEVLLYVGKYELTTQEENN